MRSISNNFSTIARTVRITAQNRVITVNALAHPRPPHKTGRFKCACGNENTAHLCADAASVFPHIAVNNDVRVAPADAALSTHSPGT